MNAEKLLRLAGTTALFVLCLAGFYFLSYALMGFHKSVGPLWPATGVLLAALLLSPRQHWWYWALISIATSTVYAELLVPAPRFAVAQTTLIGAAQVVAQAWLITQWLQRPLRFERTRDVAVLLLVVASVNLVTTPLAASAVAAIRSDNLLVYMRTRWLSHTLTALTLTPFYVTWAAASRTSPRWHWRKFFEWTALLAGTLVIAWLAIIPDGLLAPYLPAPYLCLLPLAVAALRFHSRGAATITFVVMLYVMIAVGRGAAWPEGDDIVSRMARAQLFLGVVSLMGLLLGTSMAERDQRTRQLRESEERYRSAMHDSAIGMALVSPEGRWLEVNPKFCQIIGYTREELLQRDARTLTYAEDMPRNLEEFQALVSGQSNSIEFEKRYIHKSGQLVWVRITSTLLRDEAGRPLHFVTQTQDITDRKHAEAELEAAAARLALALRASGLGVWRHNLQTKSVEWDDRTFAIFGFRPSTEALTETLILSAIAEEDRPRVEVSWRSPLPRDRIYRMACRLRWPDGQLRHLELQGIVEHDREGRPEWMTGVANDTTDLIRATTESERLRLQLQQAQKMEALGNLAAGVAHDFNTLLSGINVFVEMASTTLAPSHEATSLLQQARRGATSARALAQRILDYSRGSKGSTKIVVNVVELVRDTAPLLAAALPANISLSTVAQCEEAFVFADMSQLQQILMNLCTNAAHAIGDGAGMVEIRVAIDPQPDPASSVRITVTDNGRGMDEPTRARIFEPYFTTRRDGTGSGLGLVIVRDIVAAYEGTIAVQSSPGKGTAVAIQLPRHFAPGNRE
jgi:PAS domain S-box-containing protein